MGTSPTAALAKAEGKPWVWHGADCLKPDYRRCLIALSPGGGDASVIREFDLLAKAFVEDGFKLPEAVGGTQWSQLVDTNSPDAPAGASFAFGSVYEVTGRSLRLFSLVS